MARKHTWVYLVRDADTGYFKIGWAVDPRKRLRDIQKEPVLLPRPHNFSLVEAWHGDQSDEATLHKLLKKHRVRGEWFDLEDASTVFEYFFYRHSLIEGSPTPRIQERRIEQMLEAALDYDDDSGSILDFAVEGCGWPIQ